MENVIRIHNIFRVIVKFKLFTNTRINTFFLYGNENTDIKNKVSFIVFNLFLALQINLFYHILAK